MNARLVTAFVAAVLFLVAGFTAMNEAGGGLRLAYMWLGLAMAATVLTVGLPGARNQG
jgi:hypothetical protein